MENLERRIDTVTGLKNIGLSLLPIYTYKALKGNYEMSKLEYFSAFATDITLLLSFGIPIGDYLLREVILK